MGHDRGRNVMDIIEPERESEDGSYVHGYFMWTISEQLCFT
jgi:hypothetical protein